MVVSSSLNPGFESQPQGSKDSSGTSNLVVIESSHSGDALSSSAADQVSLEKQSGEEFESTSISSSSYQNGTAISGDTLTWGVQSSWDGIDYTAQGDFASDKYAFVIDSGVSDSTGDLNIHPTWSKSWVQGETWSDDLNGHGTHVAGTIAAKANGSGVVGVAPGAMVIALQVLDQTGSGSLFHVNEAINYAVGLIEGNNLGLSDTVINLSLGGDYSSYLDSSIKNAASKGIRFSIAAGNEGSDADFFSPASAGDHANVFTVSAVNHQNEMASFSNWDDPLGGDDVDFSAPGVNILSLTQNGGLTSWDGTSMAAPHVAGLLLLDEGVKAGEIGSANAGGYADPLAVIGTPSSIPTDAIAPSITGPSGSSGDSTSSVSINENIKSVTTFTANETVTWSLSGGVDQGRFSINSSSGALSFGSAPDYESPQDSGENNTYVVTVRATDGSNNTADQIVTVNVQDVDEPLPSPVSTPTPSPTPSPAPSPSPSPTPSPTPTPSPAPTPSPEPSPSPSSDSDQQNDGFTQLSDGDDSLTGQSDIKLRMMGGNDYLEVIGGVDNFANGNLGDDVMILRGGRGEYLGGKDNDTMEVYSAISGSSVNGNLGDDYVTGFVAGVVYRGGKDNDMMVVSQGDVWGDKGADTFVGVSGDGYALIQDYTIGEDVVELEMDGSWSNVGDGLMFTDDNGDQIMLLLGIDDVEQVTVL